MITFNAKDNEKSYYLTHYREYPIYEPAEGGYYYAGSDWDCYWESDSMDEIRDKFNEMKSELEEEGYRVWEFEYKDINVGLMAVKYSPYIGHGEYWLLEEKLGSDAHGYEPYC